jgi:hypothetical protein
MRLDDRTIRVYFAALDPHRFGRIAYADVLASDPLRVVRLAPEPVLDLGEQGTFDDSGVNPSCIVRVADEWRMYYIGWQRAERVPYLLFSGLSVAAGPDGPFRRVGRVPVLDRTAMEPFLRSAPVVQQEGAGFSAWYVAASGWTIADDRLRPCYEIRRVESTDGVRWAASGEICIAARTADEYGFGRPWVVRTADGYDMWYSVRSRSRPYRIGRAESRDGRTWVRRDDDEGLEPSGSGWDSEMMCYGCVVDAGGSRYMFYNGNSHGASGFGCAVLERD